MLPKIVSLAGLLGRKVTKGCVSGESAPLGQNLKTPWVPGSQWPRVLPFSDHPEFLSPFSAGVLWKSLQVGLLTFKDAGA